MHHRSLVPFFRSIGVSSRCKVDAERSTLQRVLPVDIETMHLPPIVWTLNEAGSPGDCVAILPAACSTGSAILRNMQRNPPELEWNASVQMVHCACGEYHIQVTLTAEGAAGDILAPQQQPLKKGNPLPVWWPKNLCPI